MVPQNKNQVIFEGFLQRINRMNHHFQTILFLVQEGKNNTGRDLFIGEKNKIIIIKKMVNKRQKKVGKFKCFETFKYYNN